MVNLREESYSKERSKPGGKLRVSPTRKRGRARPTTRRGAESEPGPHSVHNVHNGHSGHEGDREAFGGAAPTVPILFFAPLGDVVSRGMPMTCGRGLWPMRVCCECCNGYRERYE